MYLTQVQAVLFTVISATSYYQFLGSTPLKSHMVFTVSKSTTELLIPKLQASQESIWRVWKHGNNKEAREVSIP